MNEETRQIRQRRRRLGHRREPQQIAHADPPVSYTHLRAHETVLDLVCRLLLEKKKQDTTEDAITLIADKEQTAHSRMNDTRVCTLARSSK